jgi:hypothetical protein
MNSWSLAPYWNVERSSHTPRHPLLLFSLGNPQSAYRREHPRLDGLAARLLTGRLGAFVYLFQSFGTAAGLKHIVRKTLDYLAFLGKATWLKSAVLKERLTIPVRL